MMTLRFIGRVAILMGLGGCYTMGGLGGSDTGNPDTKTAPSVAPTLTRSVCNTLNFCISGFDRNSCQAQAALIPATAPLLGLPEKQTLRDVDVALKTNEAELRQASYTACLKHLSSLSCSELPLDEIWDPNQASDFRGLNRFWSSVQHVCGRIVVPKP
jgi:hypothetical protein